MIERPYFLRIVEIASDIIEHLPYQISTYFKKYLYFEFHFKTHFFFFFRLILKKSEEEDDEGFDEEDRDIPKNKKENHQNLMISRFEPQRKNSNFIEKKMNYYKLFQNKY